MVPYAVYADGIYVPHAPQRVLSGAGRLSDLGDEAQRTGARRLLIITSPSVASRTPQVDRVRHALGAACAGVFDSVQPHAPIDNLINGARLARYLGVDGLVSCGGGSAIDVSKGVALMLGADLADADALEPWFADSTEASRRVSISCRMPHLAVPTTSSGAEFTGVLGLSECKPPRKRLILDEALVPGVVILDPTATLTTPPALWLSSAVRALDHAVEALYGRGASPLTETLALRAVSLLFDALPRSHVDGADLQARLTTQIATWHATWAAVRAGTGLSHGLGYVLGGSYGVPHGLCSCATLAAVMTWNIEVTTTPQALIARASGRIAIGQDDAAAAGQAAIAVRDLVGELGLPQRLRELGGVAHEDLAAIAECAMGLPHIASNPRVARSAGEILELLEAAW